MPSERRHHQPTESRIHAPLSISSDAPIVGASSDTDEAPPARFSLLALGAAGSGASVASGLGGDDGAVSEADWVVAEPSAPDCAAPCSPASARTCAGRAINARDRTAVRAHGYARRASVDVNAMAVPYRWETVLREVYDSHHHGRVRLAHRPYDKSRGPSVCAPLGHAPLSARQSSFSSASACWACLRARCS